MMKIQNFSDIVYFILYFFVEKEGVKIATRKEYRDYLLEKLSVLDNIMCRPMMGEYLLYYNNILFGGIYDQRLLLKIVPTNKQYNLEENIPYEGAKPMYLFTELDNSELLKEVVVETSKSLKPKVK